MLTWTSCEMTSLSRFFEKKGGGASQGDVGLDRQTMGKNRERVRFSPRPGRRDRSGKGRTCRTCHAARRDGFPDLLRGEISSCGGSAPRGGVRGYIRGDVARRHGSARDAVGWHGEGGGTLPRFGRPVPGPFGRPAPSSLLPSA